MKLENGRYDQDELDKNSTIGSLAINDELLEYHQNYSSAKKMTAQEMFEDLEYKIKQRDSYSIEYVKKTKIDYIPNTKRTIEEHINFVGEDIEGIETYKTIIDKQFLKESTNTLEKAFLDTFEIKAIYKQMEELGGL